MILKSETISLCKQCFAAIVTLQLHFHLGVSQGIPAVLLPQLESPNSEIQISAVDASWIASLSILPMPIVALYAGVLMELYGRKRVVQMMFIPLFIGWGMINLADSVLVLCLGRLITGFAVGVDSAVVVYIAEISTPKVRGMLLSLTGLVIQISTTIAYLVGHYLYWKTAALVLCVSSALSFFLFFLIPESPVWLVSKGHIPLATNSLKWFRGELANTDAEIKAYQMQLLVTDDEPQMSYVQKILSTKAWKPFLIASLFFFLQQCTGGSIMLSYTVNFFDQIGTPVDGFLSSMIYTVLCFVSVCIFTLTVERFNRKTFTVFSAFGMCATGMGAAIYTYVFNNAEPKPFYWTPLLCMWGYAVVATLGVFPIPWIIAGELIPAKVRGFMTGLLWFTVYMEIFAVVKLYPLILPIVKIYGLLTIFSVIAFITAIFGIFVIPETRGKTLAEIENYWL